jgi:hypothetical protein
MGNMRAKTAEGLAESRRYDGKQEAKEAQQRSSQAQGRNPR